jgi:hypothetical protein
MARERWYDTVLVMRWTRPRLARIAGGWLVLHVCLLGLIPTTLCSTVSAASRTTKCACVHEDTSSCPMHKPSAKVQKASAAHTCSCRSAADPVAAIAAALTGPAAVLSRPSVVADLSRAVVCTPASIPGLLESSSVPDPPPPRQ